MSKNELYNPKDLPGCFRPCDKYWDDDKVKEELNLNGTEHADHYGHHIMCTHFVVESKSKGKINKAIRQLENTVPVLERKGYKIDRVVIYCDRLNKSDARIYTTKRDSKKKKNYKNFLYDSSLNKLVEIITPKKRYPVEIIYRGNVK